MICVFNLYIQGSFLRFKTYILTGLFLLRMSLQQFIISQTLFTLSCYNVYVTVKCKFVFVNKTVTIIYGWWCVQEHWERRTEKLLFWSFMLTNLKKRWILNVDTSFSYLHQQIIKFSVNKLKSTVCFENSVL